ncbi:MAG TPA: murein L,D-transpeptidase catalytic domain family protein, partial [Chitinophagaceae bacterium]
MSKSAPVNDSLATYETPATTSKSMLSSLYQSLNLSGFGLSKEAFDYAIQGYQKLVDNGEVENNKYLTVIDFSQSSRKKRFYLIDVENQELVVNTFVSHGKNSGVDMAKSFSDRINSNQSSLGF